MRAKELAAAYAKGLEDGRREAEPASNESDVKAAPAGAIRDDAALRVNGTGQMEESLRTIAECHRKIGQIKGRREGRREGLREGYQAGLLAAGFAALFHLFCATQQEQNARRLLLHLLWFGMVCTAGAFGYCCLLGPEEHWHVGSVVKN